MAETRPPIPSATHVSGRRLVAHFVDGTINTVLFLVAILLVGRGDTYVVED